MSWLSRTINRNKNTLGAIATVFPPAALMIPSKPTLAGGAKGLAIGAVGATAITAAPAVAAGGGGFFSSITGGIKSFFSDTASNLLGGLSNRGETLPTPPAPSLTDNLLGGLVSYFRSTPAGVKVEAEATKQAINEKILTIVKTPWVWIGIGVVVIVYFFFIRRR